jgi:hypothetical protein
VQKLRITVRVFGKDPYGLAPRNALGGRNAEYHVPVRRITHNIGDNIDDTKRSPAQASIEIAIKGYSVIGKKFGIHYSLAG